MTAKTSDAGGWRLHFDAMATALAGLAADVDGWLLDYDAETSDFVRFNGARIRQAGSVRRARARVTLVRNRCHASAGVDLTGRMEGDTARLRALLGELRAHLAIAETDPWLNHSETVHDTQTVLGANLPAGAEAVERIARAARGLDLVGIWAAGEIAIGFANGLGQRNWHACASFDFDWSLHDGGRAVKRRMAGTGWDPGRLDAEIAIAARELALLARAPHEPAPGRYRAWIAPAALAEVLHLLSWDGFGLRAHRTRQSPLARLAAGSATFDARVALTEGMPGAPAPRFTREGFVKPERVPLVRDGRHAGCLAGARAAKEYATEVNATGESPVALEMGPGDLDDDAILAALDDGLWIGNLWYLNYADRDDCRITGATRFACFRVEGGRLRAPLASMRFDQSLYDLLGPALAAIGRDAPLMLDPGTYDGRSVRSLRAPGILVDGFTLAL